jgi:WD40 repeat protein
MRRKLLCFLIGIFIISTTFIINVNSNLIKTNDILPSGSPNILWIEEEHDNSVYSVTFSHDNQLVASGSGDSTAKLWQASDGTLLKTFPGHDNGVVSVGISPNNEIIAVGYLVSGYPPGGKTNLWDISQETVIDDFGGAYLSFSSDGEYIATGGGGANRYLYVHRISTGQEICNAYSGTYITDIDFSPDGQIVASSGTDNTIKLWDATNGSLIRTLSGHTDDISTIDFSPDGQLIASGANGFDDPGEAAIKIWQVSDGQLLQTLDGYDTSVFAVDFSSDGQYLISSGRDGYSPNIHLKIKIWRLSDGMLSIEYDESATAYDIKFSPNGQFFCFGSPYKEVAVAYNPIIPNEPPSTPTIEGPTEGIVGEEYDYTISSIDPEGDDVYFWIEWGDGCPAVNWIGPYESGEEVTISHTWPDSGTYMIQAKAKDVNDAESDWGYLEVTMPMNQQSEDYLFRHLLDQFPNSFPALRYIFSCN